MLTEAELQDVFSRALPDLEDEPALPDFRAPARNRGRVIRRRRRLAAGIGTLAAAGLVTGIVMHPAWLQGPADRTTGPATAAHATPEPMASGAANDAEHAAPAEAAQERLREILARHLPDAVESIDRDRDDHGPWYLLTKRDGLTLRLGATDQAVRPFHGKPGRLDLCGQPPGLPGGPDVPGDACDRRTLPGGGRAVAARYTDPDSGITFVWVSILTPEGKSRYLVSEDIPAQIPERAQPLTADELFTLIANRDVIDGLNALTREQR
ncbi:hypothetical protein [Embleya sp. NPDC001921]